MTDITLPTSIECCHPVAWWPISIVGVQPGVQRCHWLLPRRCINRILPWLVCCQAMFSTGDGLRTWDLTATSVVFEPRWFLVLRKWSDDHRHGWNNSLHVMWTSRTINLGRFNLLDLGTHWDEKTDPQYCCCCCCLLLLINPSSYHSSTAISHQSSSLAITHNNPSPTIIDSCKSS